MKVAINSFVRRQTAESEFTHYDGSEADLLYHIELSMDLRRGGISPGYREGVILVEVPPDNFYTGVVELKEGDKLVGEFKSRSEGEEPRKSTHVIRETKKIPAKRVQVVLYGHDVLEEDEGAETDAEYEVIAINGHPTDELAPIATMTLMHNHFGSDGGTATNMTPEEFESQMRESFNYWKNKAMVTA